MNKNTIGNNIKKYRKIKNLTRIDLSKKIGVSSSTLANYENGNRLPNIEMLIKISDSLDVSIDCLCGKETIIDKYKSLEIEKLTLEQLLNLWNDVISIQSRAAKAINTQYEKIMNDKPK